MFYLISIVLITAILIILMIGFRSYRLTFWMNFVNSNFIEKMDVFLEKKIEVAKKTTKNNFIVTRKILAVLSLEVTKFIVKIKNLFNLVFKDIIKKTNNQLGKIYEQKVARQPSDYLKNIEQHKKETVIEREDF